MRKSGILYPNQHIDSDCFSAALPIFELFSHTIPFDAYPSSSKHRRQDSRLSRRGMHHEHFTPSLFLQACCLGSYRFSLFRVIHTRMTTVSISLFYDKSDSFSRSYPSATKSFSSSLCLSNSSHAKSSSMAGRDDEKVCCIDGVHEGLATTPPFLMKEYTPVICGNRHGGCLFVASSTVGLEQKRVVLVCTYPRTDMRTWTPSDLGGRNLIKAQFRAR